MAQYKSFIQLGSTVGAVTGGTTMSWGTNVPLLFDTSMFSKVNVAVNVFTMNGTTKASFSFQENFSDLGYLETGNTGTISATGVYWITHDLISSTGSNPASLRGSSPLLGTGREKQVVSSVTQGSLGSVGFSVYIAPYQD